MKLYRKIDQLIWFFLRNNLDNKIFLLKNKKRFEVNFVNEFMYKETSITDSSTYSTSTPYVDWQQVVTTILGNSAVQK